MIGLLEIRRRKRQYALISTIVALIAFLVIMVNGFATSISDGFGSAIRNFDADGVAYAEGAQRSLFRSEMPAETLHALANTPGVEAVAPIGYMNLDYRTPDGEVQNFSAFGYVPGTIGEPEIVSGRGLLAGETRTLLADRRFLEDQDLAVGDTLTVVYQLQAMNFTIVGEIDQGYLEFVPVVYILLDTWQDLRYAGAESPAAASIALVDGDSAPGSTGPGFEIITTAEAFNSIEGMSVMAGMLLAMQVGGYAIGAAVVGMFFYVVTVQKVPNIGLLKAIGASSAYVVRQAVVQALVIAFVATALSVPFAAVTVTALNNVPNMVPLQVGPETYLTTAVALVVTSLLGVLFSVRSLVKVDPIIALARQQ